MKHKNKIILAIIFVSLFFFPSFILAHPLDESGTINVYDQKQSLIVGLAESNLTIDLTFYPIEKIKVWESIDKNKDQKLDASEKETWMNKGEDSSKLQIGDTLYPFNATSVVIPDYYEFFSQKPAHVQITSHVQQKITLSDNLKYIYVGKDKKLEEIELEVKGSNNIQIKEIHKIDSDSVQLFLEEGNKNAPSVLGAASNSHINKFLNTFVKPDSITFPFILLSFGIAFVLGALHAMTPGHGKALVAGYLVGEKGTIKNAIQLGGIITITHTASVFILGLLALFLTQYIVPLTVIRYMNIGSGIAITGLGLFLLLKRIKNLFDEKKTHTHEHSEHTHTHKNLTIKSLLPLGISGGVVPCVDALAILLVAMSLQKIALGLFLLIFFSIGLASALMLAGILVVIAKNKAEQKFTRVIKYQKYLGIISALIVCLLGISLLFYV